MIIIDTNCLLAIHVTSDPDHKQVVETLQTAREQFIISPYVLAEFDYLMSQVGSVDREVRAIRNVLSSIFVHADLSKNDIAQCCEVIEKYSDLDIGLADASLLVLAHRYETQKIMTLDRRHFGTLKGLNGKALKLLPILK